MDTSACIINELTQGKEIAMHLKSLLSLEPSSQTKQVLIQEIISSYDRAMLMVNGGDSGGQTPSLAPALHNQSESSVSIDESPRSQGFNQPFDNLQDDKLVSKKRKDILPAWPNQIKISTVNGLEGNSDDVYSWRKYGQKDILGSKFPRSYYRCTYRYVHHCMAKKQVQRTNEDPTVFEITYKGQHTCNPTATPPVAPPHSPEKLDHTEQNNHQLLLLPNHVTTSNLDSSVPCSFSFPSTSFGSIESYQHEIDYNVLQGYSPSFISPAASGSNYLTEGGSYFHHHDHDSNVSGITATSATNSPFVDPQDHSQDFEFNNSGYLN
ncbi:putative WRKY transcription factor 41 [Bidens hawaiensis]|uniref:putative WRKY transcription factor 41 n=1 Tax=Bidens hawaiensis TaxID=980011 RepID=UPI0040491082